jgi:hypothetical protein
MRIRASVAWLLVVAAALIVLTIWFGRNRTETPVASPEQTNAAAVVDKTSTRASQPSQPHQPSNPPIAPSANVPAGTNVSSLFPGSQAEQMLNILSNYNDEPIVFYGKLEDQLGIPVADATVAFEVRVYNGYESTVDRGQAGTDANGLFTIAGYKGESLSLVPKKAGYAIASTNRFANYSRLFPDQERPHPDPNNPVVIKMWRLRGPEPLTGISKQYKLRYTETPICFDLLAGQIVPGGGDLKITVSRAPGVISGRNPLDWSLRIEAVDGGLIDSSGREPVTYEAPETGYQPAETFTFSTSAPNKWFEGFDQGFFVMSRNRQVFTKLGLSFTINYDPDGFMYLSFRGLASTNGSRNWEGDPNTLKPQ